MTATITNFPIATPLKAQGYYSFKVTITDDGVYSWAIPGTSGFLFVSTNSVTFYGSMSWVRGSAAIKMSGATAYAALSSALTGTTGTVGNITIGAAANMLYLENRSGASRTFTVTLLCDNASVE